MRAAIAIGAMVALTAGTAFAQQEAPCELGATQHPPIHSEPAAPPTTADAPKLPNAAPVINSEEQARAKIESEEQARRCCRWNSVSTPSQPPTRIRCDRTDSISCCVYPRPAPHDAFTMSMMTPVSMRASRKWSP